MDLHLNDDVQEDERMEMPPPFTLPSSRGSGVSMRSLLSSDSPRTPQTNVASTVAPITQPPFTATRPGGLSSLMNSPMQDDAQLHVTHNMGTMATPATEYQSTLPIQQQRPEVPEDPDVDMNDADNTTNKHRRRLSSVASNESGASASLDAVVSPRSPSAAAVHIVDSLDFEDPELSILQKELQDTVQAYLAAVSKSAAGSAPPTKRARKGRQQKKRSQPQQPDAAAAAEVAAQLQNVQRSIRQLQSKILSDGVCHPNPEDAMQDIIRLCLAFLRIVPDPNRSSSEPTTRQAYQSLQDALIAALVRAVFSTNDAATTYRLLQAVYVWWTQQQQQPPQNETPPVYTWLWLQLARPDIWTVFTFLLVRASHPDTDRPEEQRRRVVVVVDALVPELGDASVAHIVHTLFQRLASSSATSESSSSPAAPLSPDDDWISSSLSTLLPSTDVHQSIAGLLAVATESSTLVRTLDASLSTLLDRSLVVALWRRIESAPTHANALRDPLLVLLRTRMSDTRHGGADVLRLLHALMDDSSGDDSSDVAVPPSLRAHASAFHDALLRFVTTADAADTSAQRLLQQLTERLLQQLTERLPSIAQRTVERRAAAERWAPWLTLLARQTSRRDVFARLVDADLVLAETSSRRRGASNDTSALCTLLVSLAGDDAGASPSTSASRLSELLHHLVACCQRTTSRRSRSRLLAVIRDVLVRANSLASASNTSHTVVVPATALASPRALVAAFTTPRAWRESWRDLERQRGASGASTCWSFALQLLTQRDVSPSVSRRALEILRLTPMPTLEDPTWQFQCVRQLTTAFFLVLRRFRIALVYSDQSASASASAPLASQLDALRVILVRLLATDGGIARYAASLWTQLVVLWMDEMWSSSSATSVPTHFPNPLQHQQTAPRDEEEEDEEVEEKTNAVKQRVDERDDVVTIRSERTISSKCTNLQSSQVITKRTSDLLVYRKALDETWARELHAARRCSSLALDVLASLVDTTPGMTPSGLSHADVDDHNTNGSSINSDDGAQRERRLRGLVDVLLERALPCCGIPSDDAYKETLPNRSSVDMDLRIEQWLNHFPAFLPLLRLVLKTSLASGTASAQAQALRVLPLLKSALVVLLGHWNSVKGELDVENMDVPPYMRNQNQLALSCELLEILRLSGWLPPPLARTAELLPLTTPSDIRAILFSCWFFLADHPPTAAEPLAPSAGNSKMPIEFYVLPVRRALHHNIHKIGAKYPLFMC
ncbi:hypothetical protein PINS_up012393 [Pythium insidiosum]|nr:hypothetical protein PINS_up012393 [Pythium insidiosum]